MPFADPHVSVTQTEDGRWKLDRPLSYSDDGVTAVIEPGYVTDFATVPRIIWWLVPTYGNYTAATVLHDWMITDLLPTGQITSQRVDRVFREAMKALGVSMPRRWLMWAGVRWGALFNPDRRAGWHKTAPGVLLISALALPFLLPALFVVPSLLIFTLLERLFK